MGKDKKPLLIENVTITDAGAKGKFYFIAIKIRFVTTYNRQDLLRDYPSQSLKIVLYLFLLVVELTLVVHMLPLAPTTIGEVLTYGDYSQWRLLVELHFP